MTRPSIADMIKAIKTPTPEEHRAISLRWLARVQPTLIDQWPTGLAALSMPTVLVKCPEGLVKEFWDLHDGKEPGPLMNGFAAELDVLMGWKRKFIRLNSRSPKDAPWPFELPVTCSGKEALGIMSCSERILDDLLEFKYVPEQPAYVCLRDFIPGLHSQEEYRCFVKDGELIAVTHYDYTHPWRGPVDGGKELRRRIDKWFTETLRPVLHLDTVVFDIWVKRDGFLLIEINPYGLSDPCYFGGYGDVESADCWIKYAETNGGQS